MRKIHRQLSGIRGPNRIRQNLENKVADNASAGRYFIEEMLQKDLDGTKVHNQRTKFVIYGRLFVKSILKGDFSTFRDSTDVISERLFYIGRIRLRRLGTDSQGGASANTNTDTNTNTNTNIRFKINPHTKKPAHMLDRF